MRCCDLILLNGMINGIIGWPVCNTSLNTKTSKLIQLVIIKLFCFQHVNISMYSKQAVGMIVISVY